MTLYSLVVLLVSVFDRECTGTSRVTGITARLEFFVKVPVLGTDTP